MIGPPIQDILEKIYPGLDSEFVDSFRVCFRHHYDVHGFSIYLVPELSPVNSCGKTRVFVCLLLQINQHSYQ